MLLTKPKFSHSYLIANTELFKADKTLAAISWHSLEPKFWEFLNKSLNCFSLQEKHVHQINEKQSKVPFKTILVMRNKLQVTNKGDTTKHPSLECWRISERLVGHFYRFGKSQILLCSQLYTTCLVLSLRKIKFNYVGNISFFFSPSNSKYLCWCQVESWVVCSILAHPSHFLASSFKCPVRHTYHVN